MQTDGECRNCGYWKGLHHYKTMQCPKGGEAPPDKKQEWRDVTFDPKEEAKCCFCNGIMGALIKLYQGWCCVPCFKKHILEVSGNSSQP